MKKTFFTALMMLGCATLFGQVTDTTRRDSTMRNRTDTMWQNQQDTSRHRQDTMWRENRNQNDTNRRNRNQNDTNWKDRRDRGDTAWQNRNRNNRMDRNRNNRKVKDTMVMGSENQWNTNENHQALGDNQPARNTYESQSTAALPVLVSYVPDEIVTNLQGQHGENLYSITCVKLHGDDNAYAVTTIQNGTAQYSTIGADGKQIDYQQEQERLRQENERDRATRDDNRMDQNNQMNQGTQNETNPGNQN